MKSAAGLYKKYNVTRVDGESREGGKHDGCYYFVLDLTCDPHAVPALEAYAESCANDYPVLAVDLIRAAKSLKDKHTTIEHWPLISKGP